MPEIIDYENREYPRWAHRAGQPDVVVKDADAERAQEAKWDALLGVKPVTAATNNLVTDDGSPLATPSATITAPAPQFTAYDVATDSDVPLTQDRLDELLFAETVLGTLWPAIQQDQDIAGTVFPPKTTDAIGEVTNLLAAHAEPEPAPVIGDAPKPRRGRPPKPKPEAPNGTGT